MFDFAPEGLIGVTQAVPAIIAIERCSVFCQGNGQVVPEEWCSLGVDEAEQRLRFHAPRREARKEISSRVGLRERRESVMEIVVERA